ncbi:hypothetical protein K504DRAFT_51082 [Pleomassaria siparia CBS 279.74]|uniref:Uncharacterized protein n=1 Tax=Pleomassaria siparia CBS 279.74 TaxID=1314801 RepID=A0A6G1K2W1_9PLEO|nr:hypothetical protein K504DRAFT_51082 [Pleomassaria siparia CBS 279.74]
MANGFRADSNSLLKDELESNVRSSRVDSAEPGEEANTDGATADPKKILAELESFACRSKRTSMKWGEDTNNLEELRSKLATLSSSGRENAPPSFKTNGFQLLPAQLEVESRPSTLGHRAPLAKELVPSAIALQLEKTGCSWENAVCMTKYLFGSGLDGYKAQHEKEHVIKLAKQEYDHIWQDFLQNEAAENATRLSCQIVATNIAAGAEHEDLLELLRPYHV